MALSGGRSLLKEEKSQSHENSKESLSRSSCMLGWPHLFNSSPLSSLLWGWLKMMLGVLYFKKWWELSWLFCRHLRKDFIQDHPRVEIMCSQERKTPLLTQLRWSPVYFGFFPCLRRLGECIHWPSQKCKAGEGKPLDRIV